MYKLFKKTKYLLFSFLAILTIFVSSSCVVEQPKENFETFTNSVFQTLIGKDEFTSNFLFNDPESFGLERYEPSLPTPGKTQALDNRAITFLNQYNKHHTKMELVRVVRTPDGSIIVDTTGKVRGHGAYVCKKKSAITAAQKKKTLNKHLEVEVPDSVYEEMLKLLEEGN